MLPQPMVVRARTTDAGSNAPAPKTVAQPVKLDSAKLQGILYSQGGSSAIIDGQTLHQGDVISGLHVIEITPTTVTLEYKGRQRKLSLE